MTNERHASVTAARGNRAIGAMFFSVFGGAWLALWAYHEFSPPVLPLTAVALLTLALLSWSIATYRANASAVRDESQTIEAKRKSRLFNLINAGQWVTIFVLATILGNLHHQEFILPTIIFVIGVHFFPLAWLFSYRPHYITGICLVVLAITYPFLSAKGAQSASGALGAGVVLWLSAIWGLLPPSASAAPPQ